MEAAQPQQLEHTRPEAGSGTLGDVLYPDRSKTVVTEKDWLRLVESIGKGDQLALHALYERTHRLVFTLIMRITCNQETAEELTLDVFFDIWRRASRYSAANGTVLGWVMNQARSRAIDRLRFEQRKKRLDPHGGETAEEALVADACDMLALKQQGQAVRGALVVLTPQERQAIETAYFSGLTHAEVAAQLKEPLGTVKTRIRSGLQKLRQALSGEAGLA